MTHHFKQATREDTPLLLGLVGPSSSGKTRSALRLGTGIVKLRGGRLVVGDTESNRALHYAPDPGDKPDPENGTYDFLHYPFLPPHSSDAYCEFLVAAAEAAQGGCVVLDSASHEHEGAGGYLELHDEEVKRLCTSGGFKSAYAAQLPAWNVPAARRRRLINKLMQINSAFIFCFRAKEKLKLVSGKDPIPLGWQAIAGEEFVFEMTIRCLLPPGAGGRPDWTPSAFAFGVAKREDKHIPLFSDGPLDEETGFKLAQWNAGKTPKPIDWEQRFKDAKTLEEVGKVWEECRPKKQFEAIKDQRKKDLTPPAAVSKDPV